MKANTAISERSQIAILWSSVIFGIIYALALGILLRMLPPPAATLTADQIKDWYLDRQTGIKLGAMIASWTSAFMVPFWAVVAMQISRQEKGRPIWTVTALVSGGLVSIFLVLPPLFFGTAAFTPNRAPEVTAIMHQLGVLTLVTTDQYFVFAFIAVAVMCFMPPRAAHSPFPRWFGYFTIWFTFIAEAGAIAFNMRTGPFAWNGLLAFWIPFGVFGPWLAILVVLLLKSLRRQTHEFETDGQAQTPAGV
jgi:MFS family permease